MDRLNWFHRFQIWDTHLEWESAAIRDAIRRLEGDFHGIGTISGLVVTGTTNNNEISVSAGVAYTSSVAFETAEDPDIDKFSERLALASASTKIFANVLDQQYRVLLKYTDTLTGAEVEPIGGGVARKIQIESGAIIVVTTDVTIPANSVLLAIVTGTGAGNKITSNKIDLTVRTYITKSSHGHTGGVDGPQLTEDGIEDGAITEPKIDDEAIRARHIPDEEIPLSKLASLVQRKWANENLILNSNFDYILGSGTLPSFWTSQVSTGNTIVRNTDHLYGKYSIKFTKPNTGTLRFYSDHIIIKPLTTYVTSGFMKNIVAVTKDVRVKVSIYTSGDVLLITYQTDGSDSSTWARFPKSFTTPASTSYAIVECIAASSETGTFWFDGVKLEEASSATTYVPNVTDSDMRELLEDLNASKIAITDEGDLYDADEVESALAEIMEDFNTHSTKSAHDDLGINAATLGNSAKAAFLLVAGDTMEGNLLFNSGALLKKKDSGGTTFTIIDDDAKVWRAVYADLAELFPCREVDPKPGEVFVWRKGKIERCKNYQDKAVIGAYSDNYGFLLGGENKPTIKEVIKAGYVPIAISGRAKVKTLGPVKEGDLLITGTGEGIAVKSTSFTPGSVFGKALQNVPSGKTKRIDYLVVNR